MKYDFWRVYFCLCLAVSATRLLMGLCSGFLWCFGFLLPLPLPTAMSVDFMEKGTEGGFVGGFVCVCVSICPNETFISQVIHHHHHHRRDHKTWTGLFVVYKVLKAKVGVMIHVCMCGWLVISVCKVCLMVILVHIKMHQHVVLASSTSYMHRFIKLHKRWCKKNNWDSLFYN